MFFESTAPVHRAASPEPRASGARQAWFQSPCPPELQPQFVLPAPHAVHTAPGGVLDDFGFFFRRKRSEKLAVVGDFGARPLVSM